MMEVAIGANNNNTTPFQREIREWQRVDPNTRALLSGRLEADRWINGPLNAYGKIVNSQNISQLNGTQQSQRNQLEVLQARTSSGSLQVVRAQTVQTMTSTSSSSSSPSSSSHYWPPSSQQSHNRHNQIHSKQDNIFNSVDDDDQRSHINGYRDHHLHLISNDGNVSLSSNDDHHLTTSLNSNSNDHHSKRFSVTTPPSIKLSTLMKNNTAAVTTNGTLITNGGDRKSPHILNNSMSLLQRHQHQQSSEQHEQNNKNISETTPLSSSSSFTTDDRYCHHQPTITIVGETRHHRVGDVGIINTNQIQSVVRNERETNMLDQDYGKMQESSLSQQHRGRSISIDNLNTNTIGEWNHQNDDDIESSASAEWRRVSKIRRSFQFPKTNSNNSSSVLSKTNVSRPIDLPLNSGSVSRIRHELESGRRLSTAIRGNNVDLDALNIILNGTRENETRTVKKTTFLTAESLKEIRGKLKKLSDESLYKDDFVTQTNFTQDEINSEKENDARHNKNNYILQQPVVLQDSQIVQQQSFQYQPKFDGNYTTNSLENRAKYRDTNSSEWHLRRKSYGFEKMTSSENPMFRMETSTDSGIGRSGDLANWSPTENASTAMSPSNPNSNSEGQSNNNIQKTRVTLTNDERPVIVQRRLHSKNVIDSDAKYPEIKRHSIAVDETKYVGGESVRKAFEAKSTSSSIVVNGFNVKDSNSSTQINIGTPDETGRRTKRVEFCKTEVHFAAESGRVNIVETDGKPPPTNNFRRRRRSSSTSSASGGSIHNSYLETHNTSNVPVIHFGDEQKVLFSDKDNRLGEIRDHKNNITISIPIKSDQSDRVLAPVKTVVEIEDETNSEEVSLRSILKNKPIKPKPYHLGESIGDNGESLWGIRLKPTTKINYDEKDNRNYIKNNPIIDSRETFEPIKSVAERIKIVEERRDGSGYSTKINLNLSNSPHSWNVPDSDTYIEEKPTTILRLENHHHKPSSTSMLPSQSSSSSTLALTSSVPSTNATPRLSTQLTIFHDNLKSTSLIMKTLRLSNHFTDHEIEKSKYHVINGINEKIEGSNNSSTLSLVKLNDNQQSHSNYLLDENVIASNKTNDNHDEVLVKPPQSKDRSTSPSSIIISDIHDHPQIRKTNVIQKEIRTTTTSPSTQISSFKAPIAAPRIQMIGSSNAISHQLSQLRQIYDSSGHDDSDDSAKADEEVNHIFGGAQDRNFYSGTLQEDASEISNSWSRIKTKRINRRQEIKEEEQQQELISRNDGIKEFSKTNVMSIELHSPSSSITRIIPSEMTANRNIEIPIPKPRTVSPVKIVRNTLDNEHDNKTINNNTQQHEISTERKSTRKSETLINNKEPLKVVTGGARRLREHELSYFGVKTDINDLDQKTKSSQRQNTKNIISSNSNTSSSHANYNKMVLNTEETNKNVNGIQKWKLSSDKPDLLRHSPVDSKKVTGNVFPQESELPKVHNDEGPIYENLKKPSTYNRKKDLKRDEMILDEMTKTADLTLKTVNSSSNKSRDQNHSQFQQRSTKPLDTINEKTVCHQISKATHKKVKSRTAQITRQHLTDNFQRPCCSNRPSSASSVESLTRYPKSKSRSQSKESSSGKIEYANIRSTKKLSTPSARDNGKSRHRSQSRERHYQQRTRSHSRHSSSDDLEGNPKIELIPRIRKPTKLTEREAHGKDKERKRSTLTASSIKTKSHENNDHRQHGSKPVTNENLVKLRKSTTDRSTDKVSSSKRSSPASTSDRHHIHSHNQHHSSSHHSSSHNSGSQSSKVRTKSNQTGIITSTTSSPSNKHRTSKEHTRK